MANFIRLMHSLFPIGEEAPGRWRPSADMYRTPYGWLIKLDLAGVRPEDVHLSVSGRHLTVRGVRRDWTVTEDCCCYQMEITYSQFERQLTLPVDLDNARIRAEHQHGLLIVRINLE